jgi:hypothetical protein
VASYLFPARSPNRRVPLAEIKAGPQEDTELWFCVDGSFSYGGESWGGGTYLYLPFGADVKALASEKSATFFVITLPMLADIAPPAAPACIRRGWCTRLKAERSSRRSPRLPGERTGCPSTTICIVLTTI